MLSSKDQCIYLLNESGFKIQVIRMNGINWIRGKWINCEEIFIEAIAIELDSKDLGKMFFDINGNLI